MAYDERDVYEVDYQKVLINEGIDRITSVSRKMKENLAAETFNLDANECK